MMHRPLLDEEADKSRTNALFEMPGQAVPRHGLEQPFLHGMMNGVPGMNFGAHGFPAHDNSQAYSQPHIPGFGNWMMAPPTRGILPTAQIPEDYPRNGQYNAAPVVSAARNVMDAHAPNRALMNCSPADHFLSAHASPDSRAGNRNQGSNDDADVRSEPARRADVATHGSSSPPNGNEQTTSGSATMLNGEPSCDTGHQDAGAGTSGAPPQTAPLPSPKLAQPDTKRVAYSGVSPSFAKETATSHTPEDKSEARPLPAAVSPPLMGESKFEAAEAPGLSSCNIPKDKVKQKLGEHAFHMLRHAMLRQQDVFVEQLWQLHRLVRTQAMKVAVAAEEAEPLSFEPVVLSDSLDRAKEAKRRSETLQLIHGMAHLPASIRSSGSAASTVTVEPAQPSPFCCRPTPVSFGSKSVALERWLSSQTTTPYAASPSGLAGPMPFNKPAQSSVSNNSYPVLDGMGPSLGMSPQGAMHMPNMMLGVHHLPMGLDNANKNSGMPMYTNFMVPGMTGPTNPLLIGQDPHAAWFQKHGRKGVLAPGASLLKTPEPHMSAMSGFPQLSSSCQTTTQWWQDPVAVFGAVMPSPMYDMRGQANITQSMPNLGMGMSMSHSMGNTHAIAASATFGGHEATPPSPIVHRKHSLTENPSSKLDAASQPVRGKPTSAGRAKKRRNTRAASPAADSQGSDNSMRMPQQPRSGDSEQPSLHLPSSGLKIVSRPDMDQQPGASVSKNDESAATILMSLMKAS